MLLESYRSLDSSAIEVLKKFLISPNTAINVLETLKMGLLQKLECKYYTLVGSRQHLTFEFQFQRILKR